MALVAFAVAFLCVVVLGSPRADDGGDGQRAHRRVTASARRPTTNSQTPRAAATYTVKTGDTLGAIAEKTGVAVERLQELNPELDPQALVSGQKIKLRE